MSESNSELVEKLLSKPDIHEQWASGYRTSENESFFEQAFDYIARELKPEPGATFLDVGCGSCAHSVRLARRGFRVRAVDFSESALAMAEANIKAKGLDSKIETKRESLLDLSFADASFDYVLCWGVLMHIPDVEKAVSELARVLKPGGTLVVSEGNMSSIEAVALRNLKRMLGKEKATVKRAAAGMEYWKISADDALVTRQADINWLVESFRSRGLTLSKRVAGQFMEAYTMVSARPLKKLIHGFNNFWFKYVKLPQLAYGNIIFLRKER
ncbi:MAG TPA: class I SAM-dependent methyltransferase [Pyrinomonadaceae bacterium]|jgi:2-polyprenyl-3-methyl-5-hydroxy-6-metoxy-1,4-benzoquinol methylase|nr:class I SAM-dependent methyltransferase [Pyrinomonadaceae bacterium]